ncbi:hypothetical protein [Bradyrhizobium sp. S69]|nr:hypothetical protein [Bradyrhizobium sp. S69]
MKLLREQAAAGGKVMIQRQDMKIIFARHIVDQIADRGRRTEMRQ